MILDYIYFFYIKEKYAIFPITRFIFSVIFRLIYLNIKLYINKLVVKNAIKVLNKRSNISIYFLEKYNNIFFSTVKRCSEFYIYSYFLTNFEYILNLFMNSNLKFLYLVVKLLKNFLTYLLYQNFKVLLRIILLKKTKYEK